MLLTRTPLEELTRRLDVAFDLCGDKTLADFRPPTRWIQAEQKVLRAANKVYSPHAFLRPLFGPRASAIDWIVPAIDIKSKRHNADTLVFLGPAIARKGAYAVRDMARELGLPLLIVERDFMGVEFWKGIELVTLQEKESWLSRARVVVQPAVVEDAPRLLLQALLAGVPVVATPECGLEAQARVKLVPFGDSKALAHAVEELWGPASRTLSRDS